MSEKRDAWRKLDEDDRFLDLSDYARPVAIVVVEMFKETGLRSVHVTALFLLAGIGAGFAVSQAGVLAYVAAGFLLQLKNLLDAVDGSLARAQNRPSRTGRFFDSVSDFAVNVAFHLGMARALFPVLGPFASYSLAALTLLSALLQCSYYNFFSVAFRTYRRGAIMSRLDETDPEEEGATPGGRAERFLYRLYLILYGWQDRWIGASVAHALGLGTSARRDSSPSSAELISRLARNGIAFSRPHLTFVSQFGLGSQLLLATLACWASAWADGAWPLAAYAGLLVIPGNLLVALDLAWLGRRWEDSEAQERRRDETASEDDGS